MTADLKLQEKLIYKVKEFNSQDPNYYSDKISLPPSVLESLVSQEKTLGLASLTHPLIFKISLDSSNFCFVGIREFTANEGEIELTGLVANKLGVDYKAIEKQQQQGEYENLNDTKVELYIDLITNIPMGKRLDLQISEVYPEINDWKWFLEAKLSRFYTTLTQGDFLYLRNTNNTVCKLKVLKTEPSSTINIIDTDLDLSIEPADEDVARKMMERAHKISKLGEEQIKMNFKNSTKINLLVSNKSSKKILVDLNSLSTSKLENNLQIKLESSYEFVDLIVSPNPYISSDSFIWSTYNKPFQPKEIEIEHDNIFLENCSTLYILPVVSGEESSANISVSISCANEKDRNFNQVDVNDNQNIESELGSDDVLCTNCGARVKKTALILHENFCLRNNVKCPQGCGKIFLRTVPSTHWHCDKCTPKSLFFGEGANSKKLHDDIFHKEYVCLDEEIGSTDEQVKFPNLIQYAFHRATDCAGLLHECRFCHLLLPRGKNSPMLLNLSSHEYQCGTRTMECDKCQKFIKLRDMKTHLRLHDLDRLQRPKPIKCSNVNCCKILKVQNGSVIDNSLGLKLCEVCYGPTYNPVYDPTLIKLKSRLERRYIIQLTKGCGNSWCKNRDCKSSGLSEILKKDELKMVDIIKYVKQNLLNLITILPGYDENLIRSVDDFNNLNTFWFCVDLSVTKKKLVADLIFEEGEYDYEWICKAVSEVNLEKFISENQMSAINSVRNWLSENGVRTDEISS
ncbi:hypothetical protein B5S33_g3871 [[Candida] boidinii]|nr:hypothetical protein B5S33_g3871 [[Candida] boidinii]